MRNTTRLMCRYHSINSLFRGVWSTLIVLTYSYLSLYIGTVSSALILLSVGSTFFIVGTLRASRVIHKVLVDTILCSTLR